MFGWLRGHELATRFTWLVIGLSSLWRGWSYLWPGALWPKSEAPVVFEFVNQSIPLWVYAFVWIFAGVVALVSIFVARLRPYAVGLNGALFLIWTLSSLGAWIWLDDANRAWVSALGFGTTGWLIVREGGRSGDG